MSHHVHKVKSFVVKIEDRAGALAKVTADMKAHDINLKGLWAWTEQPGVAYAAFLPDDPDKVTGCGCNTCCTAKPMNVLWLEGEDRPGVLDANLQALAAGGISMQDVMATSAAGKYSAIFVFAEEADLDKALAALETCCA